MTDKSTRDGRRSDHKEGRWYRLGSAGLLVVAGLLAVGLALLGVMNHRRMDALARRALEAQALEMGLGSAAALMTLRPRGPDRLQRAVTSLKDDNLRAVTVVSRGGRIKASTTEQQRGELLSDRQTLRRLRRSKALYHVSRLSGGARPVYEVWIALRPGRRGRRWRHWMRERWGHGPPRGRPPWDKAYLRLEVQVSDAGITAATRDARWTRAVTLSAAAVLLLFAVLLFVADRRARRLRLLSQRQQSLAEMGEMAAVLAHEIRTPLGVIKGHAQLLAEKSEPAAAERLGVLVEQSGRLERLVNGLLDYARPGPPRPQDVSVDELVEKACELVAGHALKREVAIIRDLEPGRVRADPDQLLQLVLNLLRNALQAAPDESTVTVRLRYRSGLAVLEVVDAGDGLPTDEAQDIFKPFVTTRPDGTGLGLAVSRRIAEAHGGALRGENAPGRGARFVLTLPMTGPEEGATT